MKILGSGTILSEAIHSVADSINQLMLSVGLWTSKRAADLDRPYGYDREQFIWSLISAVGVLWLGCGVGISQGVYGLITGTAVVTNLGIGITVIGFSLAIEGYSFWVAFTAIINSAKQSGHTVRQHLAKGLDPLKVSVLLEDSAAVAGLFVAGTCLTLTYITGNILWDSVGSIAVGTVMAISAIFLIQRNRLALLGTTDPIRREKVLAVLINDPVVAAVKDVKTERIGSENFRFKAEIDFKGEEIVKRLLKKHDYHLSVMFKQVKAMQNQRDLEQFLIKYGKDVIIQAGDEVDRLEREINKKVPEAKHVDLEID